MTSRPEALAAADEAPAQSAPPSAGLTVTVERDAAGLRQHMAAWEELSTRALEPNVFYEPLAVLPAIEAFGAGVEFFFVLIYATESTEGGRRRELLGFIPLCRQRGYRGLPVNYLRCWKHKYSFLCTPLIGKKRAAECLSAFFDWLASAPHNVSVMEFTRIGSDGPFRRLLFDVLSERGLSSCTVESFARAAFRPAADADTYLKAAMSAEHRRQMRRKEERLAERGRMEYVTLTAGSDLETWLTNFLRLESSGWKGRGKTALASRSADRSFFLSVAREAFRRGRLIMQGIELDGQPIAQYCAFVAGTGSFDFKPAYDESFSRYSPGILLELERFRYLHMHRELAWMDSCSEPDSYRNTLWRERRTVESILISVGSRKGNVLVAAMPSLRLLKRSLRRLIPRAG